MPLYVRCPYCEHPQVVASHRRGKAVFCRQCGWVYATSREQDTVRPLAISSLSELQERSSAGGKVYVIDV